MKKLLLGLVVGLSTVSLDAAVKQNTKKLPRLNFKQQEKVCRPVEALYAQIIKQITKLPEVVAAEKNIREFYKSPSFEKAEKDYHEAMAPLRQADKKYRTVKNAAYKNAVSKLPQSEQDMLNNCPWFKVD